MTEPQFPPPNALEGYLTFLKRIILEARILGWEKAPHDQIADLMDAIHNLPYFLSHWNQFDQELFRKFLVEYDKKWHGDLLVRLEDCLAHGQEARS